MSLEKIIDGLKKIVALHKSLNEIAKNKTDVIIKGDLESLQNILKAENKHILGIQKLNSDIQKDSRDFLNSNGFYEEPTLTKVFNFSEEEDQKLLAELKFDLENQLVTLQQRNIQNQELLEQSMHFVNLSLDLLMPDIDSFNYSRSERDDFNDQQPSRSLFDSKA